MAITKIGTDALDDGAITTAKLASAVGTDILASPAITGNLTTNGLIDGRNIDTDGTKLDTIESSATADQTDAEIRTAVEAATDSNVFTDADHTKLNAVEALADVTDTTNVVAALSAGTGVAISGAGVVSVTAVALTTVQTAANQSAQLALTAQEGDIVVRSDENKTYCHNGGTAGTMSDYTLLATPTDAVLSVNSQTGAVSADHIATAVEAATDSNTFTDADHSKLNAIEASADVTDATNVTAAGALMDSELISIASVKALNQGVATGDSPTFAGVTDGYISWGAAQLNRYGAAIELQFTPTNNATLVKIGANGSNPIIFNAYTGTISSGAITSTGILTLDTSPAANGTGDLKVIPSANSTAGVGFAGQVLGVNISSTLSSNSPKQAGTWGGVTGSTAIALQADDNSYGQFQVWTAPQNSSANTVLTPRFWIKGNGEATFAGTANSAGLTVTGNSFIGNSSTHDADARLHVAASDTSPNLGSTTPETYTAFFSNSDGAYGTMFGTLGTGVGLIQQRRTNDATIYDLSLQPHGGNVGIGHTSPKSKLSIVGDGSLNTYSGTIGIENTASDKWASITLTDDIDTASASSNYYLIGRGNTYANRHMSFHVPTAANYGSGAQPKFVFASSGGDILMTIEASTGDVYHKGIVTMPLQPAGIAGCGTTTASPAIIPLNARAWGRGSLTVANNKMTVPVAGLYVVGYSHLGNQGSGACQMYITKNGSMIDGSRTQDMNSTNDNFSSSIIVTLAASDYIQFYVNQGAIHGNSSYNSMWIYLLG